MSVGGNGFGDLLKLLWRYQFAPLRVSWSCNRFKKQLTASYENNKEPFLSVEDFLQRFGFGFGFGLGLGEGLVLV